MILTEEGAKAIEEILAGDLVLSWDEETGEVKARPVLKTYVNETEELVHIRTAGEEIVSTPGHPFYSPVRGWTSAIDLRAGDILVLVNGEYAVVERVQHEILEAPVKVYNFNVAECHTYYVTDSGVLVHNICVVRDGIYRADVKVGGDPNHAVGHAHIYENHNNIASVSATGKVLAGKLNKKAVQFVADNLPAIAKGITQYYYMK